MSVMTRLIYARGGPFRHIVRQVLALYGLEIPAETVIGDRLSIKHHGFGTVIHQQTRIGNDVTIFHGVTIGRADPWVLGRDTKMERIVIEDGVMLCTGAVIVCKVGTLTVAAGSVVGANSVLTCDTGPGEIWAGAPAVFVGHVDRRTPDEMN